MFQVSSRKDKTSYNSVPSNVSLYAAENSIAEEDEEYIEAQVNQVKQHLAKGNIWISYHFKSMQR